MEMELGERARLKPAEGKTIIDPQTGRRMPAEGCEVVISVYWFRRVNEGDVMVVSEEPEQETKRGSVKAAKKETGGN